MRRDTKRPGEWEGLKGAKGGVQGTYKGLLRDTNRAMANVRYGKREEIDRQGE